jgi:putative endonuclease
MWYVYILLCRDGTYYTGASNDVDQRFIDHKNGKGGAYTRSHKPVKLVYKEKYADKSSALRRESQIKKLTKAKKERLIKND